MSEHKQNQTTTFTTFADWCRHKDSLSEEARHTVEVLLKRACTSDCDEANQILSSCTVLKLGNNKISDISPLSSLTNLTSLTLSHNEISDISPLSNLTNLTSLTLNCKISDISPLSTLTNLASLTLYHNQISDISPLSPLTNLAYLNLYENQISDISPLSTLTNLTSLNLYRNNISDISPLSTLTNLTSLNLYYNQFSDLSPLSPLTNLTSLLLYNDKFSDISPLSTLSKLNSLILHGHKFSDISPLSTLTNLTSLNLASDQIRDISPLSSLTNLTYLNLGGKLLSDISPLSSLTNLTDLNLGSKLLSDISPQRSLLEKWRTFSTISIERQKAAAAVKVAYELISQAEPEIVFSSGPDACLKSLADYKSLKKLQLVEQLSQATSEGFSPGLWKFLRNITQFPQGQAINIQMRSHLRDDRLHQYDYLTPEDFVEAISLTEYCVTKFGYVLTHKGEQALHCLNQLLEHCGCIFPYENICFVCDRPIKFSLDREHRLHALGEPAIEFADGYKLYSYHGVTLPEQYGKLHPEQWQSQWLLEEKNAELRRVLIQVIGYNRICQELQATQLDYWQEYTLLTIDDNVDSEPIHLLKMTCPSTGFVHALRVPPNINSAREAIRWVNWGVDPEEFSIQT